tara:strand:- start:56 stop:442 length:387 start_codon:yes stop_codon:yes gene_type:complete
LQRYTAIYSEGRQAFRDDHAQRCFVCRSAIPDQLFSKTYFKLLRLVTIKGMHTLLGKPCTAESIKYCLGNAVADETKIENDEEIGVSQIVVNSTTYYISDNHIVYGGELTDAHIVGVWDTEYKRVIFH